MKKLAFLLFLPALIHAVDGDLQLRAGYFYFIEHIARKIYHGGAPDMELEGQVFLKSHISLWSNCNYVWRNGSSDPLGNRTHLDLFTMSVGPKYYFHYRTVHPYLGLGITGAYLHLRDHSRFIQERTHKWGVGCVAKSGILFPCFKTFFFDVFFDYYYQPFRGSDRRQIDLGGFRTGLGFGYRF